MPSKPVRRPKGSEQGRPRTLGAEELAGYLGGLDGIRLVLPPAATLTQASGSASDVFLGLDWRGNVKTNKESSNGRKKLPNRGQKVPNYFFLLYYKRTSIFSQLLR